MDSCNATQAITMFKAVLEEGRACSATGRHFGMTGRSTSKIIKALARDLQRIVGVVDVDEEASPTLAFLRERRHEYLEALEHFVPPREYRGAKSAVASDDQVELLVAMTMKHSRFKLRDVALLLTLFGTGAKPLEIARLEVRDFLTPRGVVRTESVMRPEVAINGRERPLFFLSQKANAAIEAYLAERVERKMGTHSAPNYLGLEPTSRLFLSSNGGAMAIKVKETGKSRHFQCAEILGIYRRIFGSAGIKGFTAMSARRTVAQKLKKRGTKTDEIGRMFGLSERSSVRRLLRSEPASLQVTAKELV